VGMKSYGRAPTFLTLTGYEQVRSVVAALVGDWEAARNVELVLPETGVCSTDADSRGCGSSATDLSAASLVTEAELLVRAANLAPAPRRDPVLAGVGVAAADVLSVVQSNACCSAVAHTTCCEASAKDACCGSPEAKQSSPCGCQGG
jgi:hypothetical protein